MDAARHRSDRSRSTAPARLRPAAWVAAGVASMLALTACGSSDDPPAEAAPTTTTTTTTPPTTTLPPTTTTTPPTTTLPPTTTTTPPTTTLPPTTTTEPITTIALAHGEPTGVQETEPIAPPPDEYGAEPVIEMGTLAIPKLGVDMTMFEGIRLTTLDHGPGHWPGTALPGQVGNVVVGGHRTSKHQVFRNVDQLVAGDEIIFSDDSGTYTYLVDRVEIIQPTDVWIVDPTDTPTATLFACHPPGSTAQRIAVFADLAGG